MVAKEGEYLIRWHILCAGRIVCMLQEKKADDKQVSAVVAT